MKIQSVFSKTRLGFALGLLATAVSLPFASSKNISADETQIKNSKSVLLERDKEQVESLRKFEKNRDLRLQEIDWAKLVEPTVRQRLINMYTAEKEDNLLLNAGKIQEKDRRVKIFYADFVKEGERGDDGGIGPSLHIVKYFDEKQKDGATIRTYINEHWPINESTSGILPTETIRIRTQVFNGPLNKEGAENLFVTDMMQLIWDTNEFGKYPGSPYPYLYRQHLYGNYKKERKENELANEVNQVQTPVSSPLKCISCHSSKATFTQDIFLKPWEKRTNFAAVTPDREFEKPYNEQRGFKKYMDYLSEKVQKKQLTQAYADSIKKALMNGPRLENPFIVESIQAHTTIPWVSSDIPYDNYYYDSRADIYNAKNTRWIKAGFEYYKGELIDWWSRSNLQIIP